MEFKSYIIATVFVHLLFFCSIFDIFLMSPVITGLQTLTPTGKAVAKRLVVISADGLRHSTFISKDKNKIRAEYLLKRACESLGSKNLLKQLFWKVLLLTEFEKSYRVNINQKLRTIKIFTDPILKRIVSYFSYSSSDWISSWSCCNVRRVWRGRFSGYDRMAK